MAISERTKRLLWSRSGGYCQNPACQKDFFVFFENGQVASLEELAHIIAQSDHGPRGESNISAGGRDEYANIILLCPNCHALIDKSPQQFPVDLLHSWKQQHEEAIRQVFVVPVFEERRALAQTVHKLLRANRSIFRQYGPHSPHASDPLSDAADVWRRYVLSTIIPNNRKIASLLVANEHRLSDYEKDILDSFVLHQATFAYNHVSGDKTAAAPLFPQEMNSMLMD